MKISELSPSWSSSSWDFLKEFEVVTSGNKLPDWGSAHAMTAAMRAFEAPLRRRLAELLTRNAERHQEFGGDPLETDWSRFRPLKRDREERWSDWLAHLVEHSTTGKFAADLFSRPAESCQRPEVHRELSIGNARLDLRIAWPDGSSSHLEVKTGDLSLEKTFSTAKLHHDYIGHAACDDWILLPPDHLQYWHKVALANETKYDIVIGYLTWTDVAAALRKTLVDQGETLPWRVWAWTLTGCIEQDLLHMPRIEKGAPVGDGVGFGELLIYLEDCYHVK